MQTHIDTLYFEATFTFGALILQRPPEDPRTFGLLVENIRANGLYSPLVAYEKPDGRFLVLSGSRRLSALRKIREESLERFNVLFPDGMIPIRRPK